MKENDKYKLLDFFLNKEKQKDNNKNDKEIIQIKFVQNQDEARNFIEFCNRNKKSY